MAIDLVITRVSRPTLLGRAGTMLFPVLLFLTCIGHLVPFSPGMPSGGLDPSWVHGMNQAMAQGLVLGRDISFTFGPYASVSTRIFHPATDGLMIWGALFFAVPLSLGFLLNFRNSHWLIKAVLLLWMVAEPTGLGTLFALHALLAGFYIIGREMDERPRDLRTLGCLLVLLVPFGLAPLIKGNALPIFGAVAALGCLYLLTRRNWLGAALVAGAPPLFLLLFWVAAGQNLADLAQYITAMIPIIRGYTEAMALRGPLIEPALTLIVLLLFIYNIYFSSEKDLSTKVMAILITSLSLFIIWKEGYVRQDGHATGTGTYMIPAALLMISLTEGMKLIKTKLLIAVFSVSVTFVTFYNHRPLTPNDLTQIAFRTYVGAWNGLVNRLAGTTPFALQYTSALENIAKAGGLPVLPGTSDIYSFEQASLIASGNQWNPRPVFQSYSAYTPELAEMNNAHLIGEGAPDNLFFEVQPIDGRYPSLEDGRSWPTILKNYRPAGLSPRHLILKRHDTSPVILPEPVARSRHGFGEQVDVPRDHGPLFVRMTFRKSLFGKAAELLLKSSMLRITVTLDDGTVADYRLVSGMTEAGFLLSPLVRSAKDFARLYSDPAALDGQRVRSFTITPSHLTSSWTGEYDVAFVPLP